MSCQKRVFRLLLALAAFVSIHGASWFDIQSHACLLLDLFRIYVSMALFLNVARFMNITMRVSTKAILFFTKAFIRKVTFVACS